MDKVMQKVNITELRSNLPLYLAHVRRGREMQITHRGKVIARIVPERDPAQAARERLLALAPQGACRRRHLNARRIVGSGACCSSTQTHSYLTRWSPPASSHLPLAAHPRSSQD